MQIGNRHRRPKGPNVLYAALSLFWCVVMVLAQPFVWGGPAQASPVSAADKHLNAGGNYPQLQRMKENGAIMVGQLEYHLTPGWWQYFQSCDRNKWISKSQSFEPRADFRASCEQQKTDFATAVAPTLSRDTEIVIPQDGVLFVFSEIDKQEGYDHEPGIGITLKHGQKKKALVNTLLTVGPQRYPPKKNTVAKGDHVLLKVEARLRGTFGYRHFNPQRVKVEAYLVPNVAVGDLPANTKVGGLDFQWSVDQAPPLSVETTGGKGLDPNLLPGTIGGGEAESVQLSERERLERQLIIVKQRLIGLADDPFGDKRAERQQCWQEKKDIERQLRILFIRQTRPTGNPQANPRPYIPAGDSSYILNKFNEISKLEKQLQRVEQQNLQLRADLQNLNAQQLDTIANHAFFADKVLGYVPGYSSAWGVGKGTGYVMTGKYGNALKSFLGSLPYGWGTSFTMVFDMQELNQRYATNIPGQIRK